MGNESSTLVDQLNNPPIISRDSSIPSFFIIRTAICESLPNLQITKTIIKSLIK